MLEEAALGRLPAPVAEVSVFVRLLGSAWKGEDVAGSEKRDDIDVEEAEAVGACCEDDDPLDA